MTALNKEQQAQKSMWSQLTTVTQFKVEATFLPNQCKKTELARPDTNGVTVL